MQAYCYAYYYSMPSSFDLGSAVPCIDLAVQSLGETFQGDDGKYYQADIIGDRECEILGGGVGNFDGLRAIEFSDLSGVTIVDYTGTSTPTINGNVIECTVGVLYYLELSDGSKYYFNAGAGSVVFDISDNSNHGTLITGSEVGFQTFEQGVYSYLNNYGYSKLGNAYIPALESNKAVDVLGNPLTEAGRVKYPVELWSSCLRVDGQNMFRQDTGINSSEGEEFKISFIFSLSGIIKAYECIFSIDDTIYVFSNRSGVCQFLIKNASNSIIVLSHTQALLRDGTVYDGFVSYVNDMMTLNLNGVEDTRSMIGVSKAVVNGNIEFCGDNSSSSSLFSGKLYNFDYPNKFKANFAGYGGTTIYNSYESTIGAELVVGSSVGIWDLSPYAYPRNNTLGFGRAGDAFIPIELGGSCLVMNGTDNSISINESCGLGYDEDFHYIFGFSLSESTNYHECLFNIQSDTYYGGSMFLYVKYGDIPEFRIMKKVNSSYLTYILSFPDELPRDGSKISGFVKKEGSIITMSFNGVEVSADFPGEVPAYENDVTTIGTSDSGMSSAFLTGKLFYLDIAPIFKSTFSDFSGSTIENRYEDKSAGILSGSLLNAWEISKLAVTYTGTNIGLNGSESEYKDPYVFELIEACNPLAPNFRFSSTESLLWGYDDIEGNVQDLDFMFSDVNTNTPVKDSTTTYSEALTGDCLAKANEYFKTI